MDHTVHNKIVSFIWSIADDCLRDIYVRGKYRDVILPMVVLRRLDVLLEPTKQKVLDEVRFQREDAGLTDLDPDGLTKASKYVFYNTSTWTLQRLYDTAVNNRQILEANVKAYLDGFSDNVKEIIDKFRLRAQIRHMAQKDVLHDVLEKFVDPHINLTPYAAKDPDGRKLPPLTNLGMGYVFEELIRKFNEENNEEAGEHFTPREVIDLMTHLVFEPVKNKLPPVITVYDPACGSGGMLTESQNFITDPEGRIKANADINLYGKEINDETYAICKSDMMIKGNDPANIKSGSTLSTDDFSSLRFDFMLSNPPYGKSWASEQKYIKQDGEVIDDRFLVNLKDYWSNEQTVDATPRSSDGQLLFLMEMVNKMKSLSASPSGSRIASVHNGSSLFTGDAGSGESNIRRHIIESDMLEAIIQLPNNLFYNTGITTYIWLLSNNKARKRKGKVQLIDASQLYRKLRKNLGNKNCEFAPEHIKQITQTYLKLAEVERGADEEGIASQLFDNSDFGYYKVNIERPDRRKAQFSIKRIESLRFDKTLSEPMQWAYEQWGESVYKKGPLKTQQKALLEWCEENELNLNAKNRKKLTSPDTWKKHLNMVQTATILMQAIGKREYSDFNQFKALVEAELKVQEIQLGAAEKNTILNAVSWYDEGAEKVIKKTIKLNSDKLEELLQYLSCQENELADFGYYAGDEKGEYVIYEPCTDLRDSESVPLKDNIHRYFLAEVRPHAEEAWINLDSTKVGYEISFNKYFYQHKPLRSMKVVANEIIDLERQAEGLIADILGSELKNA